jgi:hypothetical protein
MQLERAISHHDELLAIVYGISMGKSQLLRVCNPPSFFADQGFFYSRVLFSSPTFFGDAFVVALPGRRRSRR